MFYMKCVYIKVSGSRNITVTVTAAAVSPHHRTPGHNMAYQLSVTKGLVSEGRYLSPIEGGRRGLVYRAAVCTLGVAPIGPKF